MSMFMSQRKLLKSLYMSMSGPLSMGMVSKNMPGINVAKRRLFSIMWLIMVREPATSSTGELIGTNSMSFMSCSGMSCSGMSCPGMSCSAMSMAVMFQSALLKGVNFCVSGSTNMPGINVAKRRLFIIMVSPSVRGLSEITSLRVIGTKSSMAGASIAIADAASGMSIAIDAPACLNATGCSCGTCGWLSPAGGAASPSKCLKTLEVSDPPELLIVTLGESPPVVVVKPVVPVSSGRVSTTG